MKLYFTLPFVFFFFYAFSQELISGSFPSLANQSVFLTGFNGIQAYAMDSARISSNGTFELRYPSSYTGMAILEVNREQNHVIVLEPGGLNIKGADFAQKDNIQVVKGIENMRFEQYAVEHNKREMVLGGWLQMNQIYAQDPFFKQQTSAQTFIQSEIKRLRKEDSTFLAKLPDGSYNKWYLPYRGLVSNVQTLAMRRTEEIPAAIAMFRNIDFSDPRWKTSGLMRDAIESHVWLIENSAGALETVFSEINKSTDILINKLSAHPEILNAVSEHLYLFLEERSLYPCAEHLALTLLGSESCERDSDFSKMMESYRAMKKGNKASDIIFGPNTYFPEGISIQKLSELKSPYSLVIFAASWCSHCTELLPKIKSSYNKWKQNGLEVVFVSLDDDPQSFALFAAPFPFISTVDFKKWEGKAVQDYYVYATPTMYLLDQDMNIVLPIRSFEQINSWVDWYLIQGNK